MKLIIHIGAGKTGTTSIQTYLLQNQDLLNSKGFFYAGMCFETLGKDKTWKNEPWSYRELSTHILYDEFYNELNKYEQHCNRINCHTIILSNETFSNDISKLIPLFLKIKKSFDLQIFFYVRSPEKWLKSAYQQWCIKHKGYEGKIKSIKDYCANKPYKILLNTILSITSTDLKENLIVKNMEKPYLHDVVKNFTNELNLPYIKTFNANTSADTMDEAIYYLVNNRSDDAVLPDKAQKIITYINTFEIKDFREEISLKKEDLDLTDIENIKNKINYYLDEASKLNLEFNSDILKPNELDLKTIKLISAFLDAREVLSYLEVDDIIDAAFELEKKSPDKSYRLMTLASKLKPKDNFIENKIADLLKLIN